MCISLCFPMISRLFSLGFAYALLYGVSKVPLVPHGFPLASLWFPHDFPDGVPMVPLCFPIVPRTSCQEHRRSHQDAEGAASSVGEAAQCAEDAQSRSKFAAERL